MYRRHVEGRLLTFGVSGKLWKNALVMYDRETGSLWSHLTGKCIWGALEGEQLETIASTPKIKWQDWYQLHPNTHVLSVSGQEYVRSDNYNDYHKSRRTGLFDPKNQDDRLNEKDLVVGVIINGRQKAYPLDKKHWKTNKKDQWLLVQDQLDDTTPLVVFHHPDMYATSVFIRKYPDGSVISFEQQTKGYQATDTQGQTWNLLTGMGSNGQKLTPIPHMNIYWFAWADFYPQTLLWETNHSK